MIKRIKVGQNSLLNCWNEEAALDQGVKSLLYSSRDSAFAFLNKSSKYHQINKILSFLLVGCGFETIPSLLLVTVLFPVFSTGLLITGNINEGLKFGAIGLASGLLLLFQKQFFNYVRLMHQTVFTIHQRLRHISNLTESIDNLFYVLRNYKRIYKGLSLANNMSDFVVDPNSVSNNLHQLNDMLNRSLFEQENFGLFSHTGTVVAVYGYMQEAQDDYILPLEAVGEIDAYLSIVKVIKEHQAKKSNFCFVDFVEQQEPLINLKDAWNISIGSTQAKPFGIVLGGVNDPNNALLAGPISSGKSIAAKTIGSCILLGKTFGIAPAKSARMTLFDAICAGVSIKMDDDPGYSSFTNKSDRVLEMVDYIKKNPTKKIVAIMDEPYNAKIDESAEILTYDLGAKLATHSHVICVMASRHNKPTDLVEIGKWANYYLDISEDRPNDFERTFTLLPGKCEWWYNNAAKRNNYIKFID